MSRTSPQSLSRFQLVSCVQNFRLLHGARFGCRPCSRGLHLQWRKSAGHLGSLPGRVGGCFSLRRAPLMSLALSRQVALKVPKGPGSVCSGCYWSWLGKWLLFCCVFVPTCLPPPLRKWRNDVTQPHFPAPFSAWVHWGSFPDPPLAAPRGLNL